MFCPLWAAKKKVSVEGLFANVFFWAACQALAFKMIISSITSEWSNIFRMAIMLAKLENCLYKKSD